MKSKGLTYLLIVAVMAVWGIIFYRIFLSTTGDDDNGIPLRKQGQKKVLENYEATDTARLILNYRDPFLGKMAAAEAKPDTTSVKRTFIVRNTEAFKPAPPAINWEIIKYNGYIVNPTNKKIISIISINENEKMMSAGEASGGVKLIKNLKDSILVSYQGKTKYIRLK